MQQPAWGRSREFEITTRSAGRFALTQSTTGDLEDDEEQPDDQLVHGRRKRKVAFMPSMSQFVPSPFVAYYSHTPICRYHSHNLLPWTLAQGESLSSQCINTEKTPFYVLIKIYT